MEAAKVEQKLVDSGRPERALVVSAEWIGCGERECVKGYIEWPGGFRMPCLCCGGMGYLPLWKLTDRTRLR